ncbi:uncharacterized protein [Dermacentor albipictus]|uniref:uncharacterized protein n=1 Tax=Dermacentor albipictus TaxID=60249 RepID=UPI0031FD56F6
MKGSNPIEGGHSRRATSGSTEKKDKTQGEAPTVDAASLTISAAVATEPGNPSPQNGFDACSDVPSVPEITPQFTLPSIMPQATSQDPGLSSMAAVLLALRMVGLSPSEPTSPPVIWIPVDVPHPPTTQLEGAAFEVGEAARTTEQPSLSQQTHALQDLQKREEGKPQHCRVHGATAGGAQPGQSTASSHRTPNGENFAANGGETKPNQIKVQMNLAKDATGFVAGTNNAGRAAVLGKVNSSGPAEEVPGYEGNVNVGVVTSPGALATFTTAGLCAAPADHAAEHDSRGTVKTKDGAKDQESGKLADYGENGASAGRTSQNAMAVYLALAVLLASLVAAFCLLLVVEAPPRGINDRLALSTDECSDTVERTTPTIPETDALFQSVLDTNESGNEPVGSHFTGRKSSTLSTRKPVPINDTNLKVAIL